MIKKFCTKHGIEYTGNSCPECGNPETIIEKPEVETPKKEKKEKHKKPKSFKKRDVSDGDIGEKLKALMDKWNTKD